MRISTDPSDPGFDTIKERQLELGMIRVFWEGREIRDVLTADEEQGFAILFETDSRGRYIRRGDDFLFRTVRGRIRIDTGETGTVH